MAFIEKFRNVAVMLRKDEERLYAAVAEEMASGMRNEALWLKALERARGNKERQVSEYIKLRVQALRDDVHLDDQCRRQAEKRAPEKIIPPAKLNVDVLVKMIMDGAAPEEVLVVLDASDAEGLRALANTPDHSGEHALHAAIKCNQLEVAKRLLELGADMRAKNRYKRTALDIAYDKKTDTASKLLKSFL